VPDNPGGSRTSRAVARRAAIGRGGALAAGALLAACESPGRSATESAGSAAAPVGVTLLARTSETEAFTKRAAQLQERYPRIRLEHTELPGDYPTVIRANAAAGTLADAIYLQNRSIFGLAAAGTIQPLDALVRRDKVELKQWFDNGISALRIEGKLYGLPVRGQIQACYLYYNRDAFAAAGVREPNDQWTLDDLVNAADKLTVRDGSRFGYATKWSSAAVANAGIRRFGGELLSADGKRCLADTPQALAAMEWHWDLWHRRRLMNPEPSDGPGFGSGKNAMAGSEQGGNRASYNNAAKGAFRWSLVQMPKGPTGKLGADLSIDPMSLNARTAVADQAWTVLQWFTDRETGVALTQQTASSASTTPGMRRDVYCDERVLNDPNATREVMERFCRAMDAATSNTYIFPSNFRVTELDEVVVRHLNAFRDNTAAPTAATMRAFAAELQAVLDLPRGG
jgi:ABC-type glycerol-3-phosphate transport system substrate-binding protein